MNEENLKYIERQIKMALENCTCLGRDAYGEYIDNLTNSLINTIKSRTESKLKK